MTRFGILTLAIALLFGVFSSQAADKLWLGSVSSNWFDADNWQPPGVPAPEDSVTLTNGTAQLSGDLTLAALNFSGGQIVSSNTIIVTNLNWGNLPDQPAGSSRFKGGSRVVVPSEGTLQFIGDNSRGVESGRLENFGQASAMSSRGLLLFYGSVFHNAGTFLVQTDFSFDGANGPPGGFFTNSGTFVVTGQTTRVSFISVEFQNTGATFLRNGTLLCQSGSSRGPIEISLSATQQISGARFTLGRGASFPGPGLLLQAGGLIDTGTNDLILPNYQMNLGTLTGTNTCVISNFTWAGGTISGRGLVRIPPGGSMFITNGNIKTVQSRELRNEGMCSNRNDGVSLQMNGLFHNAGTLLLGAGYWFGTGAGVRGVYNSGTVLQAGNVTESAFYTSLTNSGQIIVSNGILRALLGYVQNAGSIEINAGTRLDGNCLIRGGKLAGNGRIQGWLANYGEVHPGKPVGTLEILGNFTNYGRIYLDLRTDGPLAMDSITVQFNARLYGIVTVCVQGPPPPAGPVLTVMSYASHTNQFARIDGLDLGGGRLLVPHYGSTTLTLEVQLASSRPDALSLTPCADGAYQVRFTGSTGGIYAIDASSNLLQWVRLLETNSIEGLIYFLDTQAREQPQRFYRTSRRR